MLGSCLLKFLFPVILTLKMPDVLDSQDVEDVCLFCRNLAQVSISPLKHDVWEVILFLRSFIGYLLVVEKENWLLFLFQNFL